MKNTFFFTFMIISLFLISCGGDKNDLSPPEISIIDTKPSEKLLTICGAEEMGFYLLSGDTLQFQLEITDNEALSELKVDIHDNFDCHGHGGSQTPAFDPPNVDQQTTDWFVLDIKELSGSEENLDLFLPVPENVTAGFYHFGLQVVDEAGNEAQEELIFELNVRNRMDTIPPFLNIFSPTQSPLMAQKGGQIVFTGEITDNRALDQGGNGIVFINYQKTGSENLFTGPFIVFPEGTSNQFDYELTFTVPQTLTTGEYRLFIYAQDGVRNLSQPIIFDLNVTD